MSQPNRAAGKGRPRRFASDSAHAWARNLKLGNVHAKLVLSMLTLYVDGEGCCWVGIPTLAEDCELSPDTVRRRLHWLEAIGAIARIPQWIDERGCRSGAGRGKRTSDLIKLMYDSDSEEIEARAAGDETVAISTPFSPSSQQGLNSARDSVSTPPALRQPSQSGQGLISEPEPEHSPPSPSGGEGEPDDIGSEEVGPEPEHFAPAWSAWRGHEVMRRDLALAEFRALSAERQLHCRNAVPLFNAMQDRLDRTRVPNFHLWIRSRGFEEFPTASAASPAAAAPTLFAVSSREGLAIKNLHAVGKAALFESQGRVVYPLPVTLQVLAFADLPKQSDWHWIEARNQIAAWSTFLSAHIAKARGVMETTRGSGADARRGIYAPWPWPPRKDGQTSPGEDDGINQGAA